MFNTKKKIKILFEIFKTKIYFKNFSVLNYFRVSVAHYFYPTNLFFLHGKDTTLGHLKKTLLNS